MSNRLSPSVFLYSVKKNILIKIKKFFFLSSNDCLSFFPFLKISLNTVSDERDQFVSRENHHGTIETFPKLLLNEWKFIPQEEPRHLSECREDGFRAEPKSGLCRQPVELRSCR